LESIDDFLKYESTELKIIIVYNEKSGLWKLFKIAQIIRTQPVIIPNSMYGGVTKTCPKDSLGDAIEEVLVS